MRPALRPPREVTHVGCERAQEGCDGTLADEVKSERGGAGRPSVPRDGREGFVSHEEGRGAGDETRTRAEPVHEKAVVHREVHPERSRGGGEGQVLVRRPTGRFLERLAPRVDRVQASGA